MRKVIAAINMTVDGVCDHTAVNPDEEVHQYYADLLAGAETILYGRITYELMQYWKQIIAEPTGEKATDEFAIMMDKVPKRVFSNTLANTNWETATLANRNLEEEIASLKQGSGKPVFIGSRSLILQSLKLDLIDELQLCIHPVIAGSGMLLFENLTNRTTLKLTGTKVFKSGAIILFYQPIGQKMDDDQASA
jgi:dihydrofolate reductase